MQHTPTPNLKKSWLSLATHTTFSVFQRSPRTLNVDSCGHFNDFQQNLRLSLKDEAVGEEHGARAALRSNSWAHPSLAGPRWLKFLMAAGEMSPAVLANPMLHLEKWDIRKIHQESDRCVFVCVFD